MKLEGVTLYVVYGWRVEGEDLGKCLMNLTPKVIEIGMRLVFPKDQKYGFFGEILAKVDGAEGLSDVRVVPPNAGSGQRLAHAFSMTGLAKDSFEAPLVWVVFG